MRLLLASLLLAFAAPAAAEAPITLDDALTLAARANADLGIARADVAVSRADRATARSAVLPRLDLSARFGRSYRGKTTESRTVIDPTSGAPITLTGVTEATSIPSYSASLQLSQTLFDWRQFQAIESAGSSERAAERQLDEAALTVAFTVTQRFYELVRAERTLAVLEKTVARSEQLVTRADALFSAGQPVDPVTVFDRAGTQRRQV